jgi:hypothetical protein
MAKRVSNMSELTAALMPTMESMVDLMAERVYETLNYFLLDFYNDYDPVSYRRSYDLLRSAVKVEPKRVGNKVVASVYIDYDSMDNYYNSTGYEVASWANQLIYVYRHKKRRADGTYHKINNSYGRYADRDYVIAEAQGYASIIESEDIYEKLDRRAIKLRYNAFRDGAKKYKDNPAVIYDLYNECLKYNKSLEFKPISGTYDEDWKQGELLDLALFSDEVKDINSQWGEADSLEFEIEDIN